MSANQHSNQQLTFLQEKIHQFGSAIFYNQSDAILKLPTSIVSTLKVDEFGYIWFFIQKPKQDIKHFEADFPVRMDFFKKGVDFFLQVSGKGWMITDPEEMYAFLEENDDIHPNIFQDMVLVKVKMQKADCYETAPRKKVNVLKQALNTVTTFFRSTNQVGHNTFFPAS
ncbi:MAG: hypothetical protein JWP88_1122 [Flaviaesturariibacter sp.]|nr:hypothetical protein [Flaviaesturariibacter sp.]